MDKATFEKHLIEATKRVIEFTPQFVFNDLPGEVRYLISPNCSNDDLYGPIGKDEERFPDDTFLFDDRRKVKPADVKEVVEFLWRNEKVPHWININAHSADDSYTYLELICCGRFVGPSRRLYHEKYGIPPFHCLGPTIPPNWEQGIKFDLNWHK
jgi:hypothetical protein